MLQRLCGYTTLFKEKDDSYVKRLIEQCREDNDKAQESLYRHYYAYAMGLGLRYAYTKEEAVEVVNDSFLKAFAALKNFDTNLSFKPWFRRIVINTAIDHYRSEKKHIEIQGDIEEDMVPGNYEDIISKLTADDILNLLNRLPEYQRLIFNLYEIEGYSHAEVAELLGIPVSTSRTYLTRAKVKLRILFTQTFGSVYERTI